MLEVRTKLHHNRLVGLSFGAVRVGPRPSPIPRFCIRSAVGPLTVAIGTRDVSRRHPEAIREPDPAVWTASRSSGPSPGDSGLGLEALGLDPGAPRELRAELSPKGLPGSLVLIFRVSPASLVTRDLSGWCPPGHPGRYNAPFFRFDGHARP